jgi:prolyl-tRNA synthetase
MKAEGGPIGGDYTHEFLVLAETGESEELPPEQAVDRIAQIYAGH